MDIIFSDIGDEGEISQSVFDDQKSNSSDSEAQGDEANTDNDEGDATISDEVKKVLESDLINSLESTDTIEKKAKRSYSLDFKLQAIALARQTNFTKAAKQLNIERQTLSQWSRTEERLRELNEAGMKRRRLPGGGRKPLSADLEEQLLAWLNERKAAGEVSFRAQIVERARALAGELGIAKFNASSGWIDRFMTRHKLTADTVPDSRGKGGDGPRKRSQNPPRDIHQFTIPFLNNVHRLRYERKYPSANICAITEAGFEVSIVKPEPDAAATAAAAADDDAATDQRHVFRFKMLLGARSDGTRLKPLLLLRHSETSVAQLDKFSLFFHIFFGYQFTDEHVASFLENDVARGDNAYPKLVLLDTLRPRVSQANETLAAIWNLQTLIVPAGVSRELNPVTTSIVEHLRKRVRALSQQWRESATLDTETTLEHVCVWLTAAWSELSAGEIATAFKRCGVSSALDGSEDHLVAPLAAAQRAYGYHMYTQVAAAGAGIRAGAGRFVVEPENALDGQQAMFADPRPVAKRAKVRPSAILVWNEQVEAETAAAADQLAEYYSGAAWATGAEEQI